MGEAAILRERLAGEGLDPGAWSNGPGDRYDAHDHGYDKVIPGTTFGVSLVDLGATSADGPPVITGEL